MKTLARVDTRTVRFIGAALVLVTLFMSFAGLASIPFATTISGQALWFLFGVANLALGTAILVELAMSRD
jgi:hypothetical protein